MMNLKHVLWLLPFLLAGCREQPRWAAALQAGEKTLVDYHQPSFQLAPAKPDRESSRLAEQAKKYFAERPQILAGIASGLKHREREIIGDLEPGPMLADDKGNVALSYFGGYESPMIMAGVKLLLLFGRDRELKKIYVYEVPLE